VTVPWCRPFVVSLTAGALLLLGTAACGGGAKDEAPAATVTASCQPNRDGLAPGATVVRSLVSGGQTREYRLHIPKKGVASPAVVLNWHGLGGSALLQEAYSGLVPVSNREGFILVSPDGTGSPRGFSAFPGIGSVDDVQFARDLIDRVLCDTGADARRVYSTGFSNGGFMSSRIACALGDRIAAIAPVAGVFVPQKTTCMRSMPVLAFHGTADTVVPFEEGLILGVLPYDGAVAGAQDWAVTNPAVAREQCDAIGVGEGMVSDHVVRLEVTGCSTEPVVLIKVIDGGHTWPGANDVPSLGATTREISASEMMWAFFKEKRSPARATAP
jgi:polyhydroxybutyrate depolymerase